MAKIQISQIVLEACAAVVVLSACPEPTPMPMPKADSGMQMMTADSGMAATKLYDRLGKNAGITAVINDFVGRVLANPKINGYFLNSSVDGGRLTSCLVKQVAAASGGPEVYDCKSMKESHKGLGISKSDFDDLAGDLVAALKAANVAQADIDTLVGVVAPLANDMVEDNTNNKTVYQRVGRKPAVIAVIDGFVAKVVADARINGFFATTNADRLKTCLVRQVCSIDGPCKYGMEVDAPTIEKGVSKTNACKDMAASHAAINASNKPILKGDFDALVDDLVQVLNTTTVTAADKNAILGALGPLCKDIVKGGADACK
jgi:truncated hemoglobin YjbI